MKPLERVYLERTTDARQAPGLTAAHAGERQSLEQALAENQALELLAQARIPLPQRERILAGAYGIAEYSSDMLEGRKMLWTGLLLNKRSWYLRLTVAMLVAAVVAGLVLMPGVKLWHAPGAPEEPAGVAFAAQLDEAIASQAQDIHALHAQQLAREIMSQLQERLTMTLEQKAEYQAELVDRYTSHKVDSQVVLNEMRTTQPKGKDVPDSGKINSGTAVAGTSSSLGSRPRPTSQPPSSPEDQSLSKLRSYMHVVRSLTEEDIAELPGFNCPEMSWQITCERPDHYLVTLEIHDLSRLGLELVRRCLSGADPEATLRLPESMLLIREDYACDQRQLILQIRDLEENYDLVPELKGNICYTQDAYWQNVKIEALAGHIVSTSTIDSMLIITPTPDEVRDWNGSIAGKSSLGQGRFGRINQAKAEQLVAKWREQSAAQLIWDSTNDRQGRAIARPHCWRGFYAGPNHIDPAMSDANCRTLSKLLQARGLTMPEADQEPSALIATGDAFARGTIKRVVIAVERTNCDFGELTATQEDFELIQDGTRYITIRRTGVFDNELDQARQYVSRHFTGSKRTGYIAFGKDGALEVYYLNNGKIERHVQLRANADGTVAETELD